LNLLTRKYWVIPKIEDLILAYAVKNPEVISLLEYYFSSDLLLSVAVSNHNEEMLRAYSPSASNHNDCLIIACKNRNNSALKFLTKYVNDRAMKNAMNVCIRMRNLAGVKIIASQVDITQNHLILAIDCADIRFLTTLVAKSNCNFNRPAVVAAMKGNVHAVEILIRNGACNLKEIRRVALRIENQDIWNLAGKFI
jgi:ankyrin repeat protein